MLKRLRPLTLIAVALLAGALALPAHALQFNYSTRLTLTDCNDADEAGFQSGLTMLCYDLTAGREEIWNGSAWVAYQGGGSSGGVQYTEGDTDASITGTALLWEDSGNALTPVNTSKPLPVTSAVTSVIPGTAATNLGKAEDAAHNSGDTGVAILVRRCDTASVGSDTDGDYSVPCVDSSGRLWVSSVNYVTENAATATAADIDQTGSKTIITVDVGAVQASRLYCIFQNTDVAANTTLDEFNIYMAPAGYTATSMPVAYTEADFASPSGALLMVRTGAGGDTTDATPDTTLDESDYMIIWLDVSGMDSVTFQASAAADDAAVDARCTYN